MPSKPPTKKSKTFSGTDPHPDGKWICLTTENLKKEGWDHTVTLEIKVVQSDESKVHLLLHQSRRNSDDVEYHNFHTLWIMTNIEGKWGIQFRSSFLDKASQTKNII